MRSFAFVGVDPEDEMLIGPVEALPRALARADETLSSCAVIDLHEAFAAQVLAVLDAFRDDERALIQERLNPAGGTIALGHPFAATGGRQILQTVHELRRRGGGVAACSACAAGGLAAAMVVEA